MGKGTGLGLSTVYGIVKQSGGHIECYSKVGQGTTFKIYFLRVEEKAKDVQDGLAHWPSGRETVLVAEDESTVRGIAVRVLSKQGYRVLEASNGEEAWRIAQEHIGEEIHLLLTDVVMPLMGGIELAERLKGVYPDLRVLYTSGYTDHVAMSYMASSREAAFLAKPFTPDELARKVRDVLDLPELSQKSTFQSS